MQHKSALLCCIQGNETIVCAWSVCQMDRCVLKLFNFGLEIRWFWSEWFNWVGPNCFTIFWTIFFSSRDVIIMLSIFHLLWDFLHSEFYAWGCNIHDLKIYDCPHWVVYPCWCWRWRCHFYGTRIKMCSARVVHPLDITIFNIRTTSIIGYIISIHRA